MQPAANVRELVKPSFQALYSALYAAIYSRRDCVSSVLVDWIIVMVVMK